MSATRRLASVTLDNLDDLPGQCRRCVFWELDPVARKRAEEAGDPALEKEAWISAALLEWGSCGKVCYVGESLAGYVLYAPPSYVPRSVAFPTSPVSADAALLMTAHVLPEFAGGGLGRMLVQGVAKDLVKRNIRAIEAFGDAKWEPAELRRPRGLPAVGGFQDRTPAPPLSPATPRAAQCPYVEGRCRGRAGEAAGLDDAGGGVPTGAELTA